MSAIQFHILQPGDHHHFQQIAAWYLQEWKIPAEKTLQNLEKITASNTQFQVIMLLNDIPVATGGIYDHVGLIDKEPRFAVHRHWLALVYTQPVHRQKGYGAALCTYIEAHAKNTGLPLLHLFTDTAEPLYTRLGWSVTERLTLADRHIAVMQKEL